MSRGSPRTSPSKLGLQGSSVVLCVAMTKCIRGVETMEGPARNSACAIVLTQCELTSCYKQGRLLPRWRGVSRESPPRMKGSLGFSLLVPGGRLLGSPVLDLAMPCLCMLGHVLPC